jgi:PAS domain S-box-containing protein
MREPLPGAEAERLQALSQATADLHRATLDSALDAIVRMDAAGLVTEFNPAAERMFGYARSDAVGRSMAELIVPPALRERHAHGMARYLATGDSVILGQLIEITGMRRDGTEFPVELSILRIGHSEPPFFTGFIRDITQRKELEAQLRHSQKMEAIGQLAGGVAHDFNNILTIIQGHASLLAGAVGDRQDSKDSVRQITDAAERAASLTRQLLAFSRKQVLQPTDLDLDEVVGNMIRMLERILGEDITLQVETSPTPPIVHGDVGMMEQVVLNLAVNARDAMPAGGRLVISTRMEPFDDASEREHPEATPGRFVRLSVTDTGSGIAPEHVSHLFEPFFTTKEADKGTGLGLSTVYGIVKQHRGWLTVRSEIGKGTTFNTYFPACDGSPQTPDARGAAASARGGGEIVLLVEDEPPVRQLARLVLERNGYIVLEAANGMEAMASWRAHRDRIEIVLTDIVMPGGMSGLQLADRILADLPATKIILTSGYSVDVFGTELARKDRLAFLPKPYHPQQLLRMVRTTLDAR